MVTEEKYQPEFEGSPVGSFLADLIDLARSAFKWPRINTAAFAWP